MSDDGKEKQLQPIIVVKRGGGDHDEHHGGVWKIAFADFMTAMMAFFLVMWLINAANEETRVQVASYFNPVKLTDAVAGPKGVRSSEPHSETEEHDNKTGTGDHNKSGGGGSSASDNGTEEKNEDEQASAMGEELLFKDPYAVLIDIAGKATPSQVAGALATEASNDGRPPGGEAFRDPFDPAFWRKPVDEILEQLPANADPDDTQADMVAAGQQMHVVAPKTAVARLPEEPVQKTASQPKPPGGQPMKRSGTEPETAPPKAAEVAAEAMAEAAGKAQEPASEPDPTRGKPAEDRERDARMVEAGRLQDEIIQATRDIGGGTGARPALNVENTDEGFLVSLTDDVTFGMFASASARPNSELVRYMDQVAAVLAKRDGTLIVRGHTDSRPFRTDAYDNWRLSTARAHMAYHMLVRGGVDAQRIVRIEGHADRSPKNKQDTQAAENRRIEILLVKGAT